MFIDPRFAADFARLIHHQLLDDFDSFLKRVDDFDEPPLYTQYAQLAFLGGLTTEQKNRLLIRAAVAHLPRIVEHGHGHDFYCMVSILGWDEFENGGLIRPAFWYTNPSTRPDPGDPRGILDYVQFNPPASRYSVFVAGALDHDPGYLIHDDSGTGDPWMRRVYVRLGLYSSDVYQTLR
ncbi:Imm15 family immunity protein [Actinomadura madurae]|uniref:Imm15 family immunity protein n=1 Tax=Actinomadura madurae TaxID=1993 RepID=UPI000D922379|nr:Imm15 family immunity protein [Actinomadura madurae]SPT49673.1 Uncharacterised protein [Actinomadura madurae]